MPEFGTEVITREGDLAALATRLAAAPALALDIETADWWDRKSERVSLVQLAFREGGDPRVAVVDALAVGDLEPLRPPLESGAVTKAIHNAAYDAVRLSEHFRIHTSPVHDTMLAARRAGERRYSLRALAESRLGVRLDKDEQRGDWGRRPLTGEQLRYAALDAVCTLLLYEDQAGRGQSGDYRLRLRVESRQTPLPLGGDQEAEAGPVLRAEAEGPAVSVGGSLSAAALALLGVVAELGGRYSPDRLAVSAGAAGRVGLAGWIIDRALGPEADLDEDTAKFELAGLCERGLARITPSRRLEATEAGARLWSEHKPGVYTAHDSR